MINPFKALGDLNAMRKQAAQIQAALEQEEFEINEGMSGFLFPAIRMSEW